MSSTRSSKITAKHLERKAVVYVRQSSMRQVQENVESQRLQYALGDRARELGFGQVEVIDCDLGASASLGATRREGFDRLVSLVACGEVGLVLSREISRLSRTDRDFCQLVELCQIFDTLIGDEAQVYDTSLLDDQLVLGIKATLSVVELKVLRLRLLEGQEEKARRGELVRALPSGYIHDAQNRVVKHPDRRVQEALGLIFEKFRDTWSIRQTFLWFHDSGVELPVHKYKAGKRRLAWQLPTKSFVGSVLRNPFYAGAYYFGRRQTETVYVDGELKKRTGRVLPPEQCRVFIEDHHEGYISWDRFEENQRMIRGNSLQLGSDEAVTAVREGQGLLTRLLRCGRCGRRLHVRYWGRKGTRPRYLCLGDYASGGSYCIGFGSTAVDRRIAQELVEAISPLGIQASLAAIDKLGRGEEQRREALRRQIEQLDYEAQRAFEQYDEVDPRHRLVAAELENRWNAKLAELDRVQKVLSAMALESARAFCEEDRKDLLQMGREFASVWHSEHCPQEVKKKILRTVVQEIIVDVDEEQQRLRFVVHWRGGTHTSFEMDKPRSGSGHRTSMESLTVIRKMAVRYGDDQIASVLNRLGHRTGKGRRWNEHRVATARRNHSIAGQKRAREDPEILNMNEAARYCGVSDGTIRRLVAEGILDKQQIAPYAPWELRRSDLDAEPVCGLLEHLRKTGKLVLEGGRSDTQTSLFPAPTGG